MIQYQLKLRLCKTQECQAEQWLLHLASVYNFAVRKIELNARDKIYFSKHDFRNLLARHSERLGIPSHTLQGILCTVHDAWRRCFKKIGGKPRLKGMRNKLTSIPFPDPILRPASKRISLPGFGTVRFHQMDIPEGPKKCGLPKEKGGVRRGSQLRWKCRPCDRAYAQNVRNQRITPYMFLRLRPHESLFNAFAKKSITRGIAVSIKYEDFLEIITAEPSCHYCGKQLRWQVRVSEDPAKRTGYQLDRKYNSAGYTRENTVPCCWKCNRKKAHDFTYEEMMDAMSQYRNTDLDSRLISAC